MVSVAKRAFSAKSRLCDVEFNMDLDLDLDLANPIRPILMHVAR